MQTSTSQCHNGPVLISLSVYGEGAVADAFAASWRGAQFTLIEVRWPVLE